MLIEKISADELSLFDYYRRTYVEEEEYESVDMDNYVDCTIILQPWEQAKSSFLSKLFGDKLILKKKVEVTAPKPYLMETMAKRLIDNTANWDKPKTAAQAFMQEFKRVMRQIRDGNEDLYYFTESVLFNVNDSEQLVENKFRLPYYVRSLYNSDEFSFTKDGKKYTFKAGQRLMKVIHRLADIFDVEGFDDYAIEHSKVLNTAKLKGTFCLSIHPLDFVTMSDNDCNWRSCMTWFGYGEYRQGTIEMMNSPYIVVGYLESAEPMEINGVEWNNKKYRSLYYVDSDIIMNIKGYPYKSADLDRVAIDWLKELVETNYDTIHYCDELIDFNDPETPYKIDFTTDIMYNDTNCSKDNSQSQIGYLSHLDEFTVPWKHYSGLSECMICGGTSCMDVYEPQRLYCSNCEAAPYYCEHCGRPISEDEIVEVDDVILCQDCIDEQEVAGYDVIYNELHLIENMAEFRIYIEDEYGRRNFEDYFYVYNADLQELDANIEDYFTDELAEENDINAGFLTEEVYWLRPSYLTSEGAKFFYKNRMKEYTNLLEKEQLKGVRV